MNTPIERLQTALETLAAGECHSVLLINCEV